MAKSYNLTSDSDTDKGFTNASFYHDLNDLNTIKISTDLEVRTDLGQVNADLALDKKNKTDSNGNKTKEKPPMVGIGEVFRFSTVNDKLLMVLGTLSACLHGAGMPILMIIFGDMTDSFIDAGAIKNKLDEWMPSWREQCENITQAVTEIGSDPCENVTTDYIIEDPEPPKRFISMCSWLQMPVGCAEALNSTKEPVDLLTEMSKYAVYYSILGACVLLIGYLQVLGWQTAAFKQSNQIRKKLFWNILRQEIGWFDVHQTGELNTRLSDDISKIERGIGDKLGLFFQWMSTFVVALIIGFVYGWKLTLVILAVSPLLILAGVTMGMLGSAMTGKELKAYAKAGAVAEEVLTTIRTVAAFGGEEKESKRYTDNLYEARDFGMKKGLYNGLAVGFIFVVLFSSYALAFWYGSRLVFDEEITPGNLLTVFFCVMFGSFALGNAAPNVQEFSNARGAAFAIWKIIDSEPKIDGSSTEGLKPENLKGNVEFRHVHFSYPSRPNVKVLKGFSMKIQVGQTMALVGSSGCGKSTTVQLLQRFYDPDDGQVLLDGIDLREMNVKWLRQQIGIVSQEPVLFDTTIAENIRYGQDNISMEDIVQACMQANAHDFITKLPKQYETIVGGGGAQLSGGQKQRVAIARALVRNPKILLLDEATSALDTESEAIVQQALDKVRQGRTTLIIAHRLSTVRTADIIVGLQDGVVTEEGSHNELMARQGLFYQLVMHQQVEDEETDITDSLNEAMVRSVTVRSSGHLTKRTSKQPSENRETPLTEDDDKLPVPALRRIMALNKPELPLIVLGCLSSLVVGSVQPAFAVVFSEILGVYTMLDREEAQQKVNLYSGMFVVIGVVSAVGMISQIISFVRSGEHLTMRLRQMSFRALLRMEMAYFDDHSNSVGTLCTRLATDTSTVQGATGSRLGTVFQSLSSVGVGIIIGFVFSWELTLLLLAFVPLVLLSGYFEMNVLSGNSVKQKTAFENAGKVAMEAIGNIRTLATLTKEEKFYEHYSQAIHQPHLNNLKKVHVQAIAYSFSQAVMFFAYAVGYYVGALLVKNRGLAFVDMFKVFGAIVFGAMSVGQATSLAPDYGKAKVSAAKIFQLLDRKSAIDSTDSSGHRLSDFQGVIELSDVYFSYPTRPSVTVLSGLRLKVDPGKTVALVGSSGCGKSTIVQLLERFYDPGAGCVAVDGHDVRKLNLLWLRRQIGIVSQEPVLFDASIRENIAYGDNSRHVTTGEIIEAARRANIHDFIMSLPQGYDTNVGVKGTQLSGGQKQRIAIARALIRNPKILLLDEATSALDTESEKVVQAAIDEAQEGRTSIVIAHRLSTIQNADCIAVIHHGHVVEMGTHAELIQRRGRYYKITNSQPATK